VLLQQLRKETPEEICLTETEDGDSSWAEKKRSDSTCVPTERYYHAGSDMSLYSRRHALQLHETPRSTLTGSIYTNCAIF
jgi:hypothetical protein